MMGTPPGSGSFLERTIRLRVSLTYPEVVLFQVSVLVAAIARGLDYLIPPVEEVKTLSVVETSMPLWVWGLMFVVGGVVGLLGLHFDKYPIASMGHVILMMAYIGFGAGSFITVMTSDGITGWRSSIDWLFVFAVTHWAFANACMDVWRDKIIAQRRKERSGAD